MDYHKAYTVNAKYLYNVINTQRHLMANIGTEGDTKSRNEMKRVTENSCKYNVHL